MRTLTQAVSSPGARQLQPRTLLSRLWKRIVLIYTISCERREMQRLSDETLQDIGIDRSRLNRELSRSLTDVPENRKSID